MTQLFLIIHIFIGSTLAGSAVIAALTLGLDTAQPLLIAALLGFLLSIPVSWLVARKITRPRS